MDTVKSITRKRRSCRKFTEESLSREMVTELIHDAVWVPNGSNNQPWRFVVISDKAKLEAYSDTAKRMWLEDLENAPYMKQYESTFRDPKANIFYNAPSLIVVYGNTESFWHVYDCSMVALNIHLLAEERGLGCCWIGEAHNVLALPEVKKELDIPESYELVAPIIVGYPAVKKDTDNPIKRKPFEIVYR